MFTDHNEESLSCVDSNSPEILVERVENNAIEDIERPIDLWIKKNPQIRKSEVEFLEKSNLGYGFNITSTGDLQQPITVEGWTYLLVFDKSFPKQTENKEFPIKIYLVNPGVEEFKKLYNINLKKVPYVEFDKTGMPFLFFEESVQELKNYINGQHDKLMVETMIQHAREWTVALHQYIEQRKTRAEQKKAEPRNSFWTSLMTSFFEERDTFNLYSKYVDGRTSRSREPNPRCKKIVISDRAFVQIFNESQSKIETETGGLLLGHYENGVWYVIEASDPGINAVFRVAYHEGDDVYQNHVCDVISRTYKHPLIFLGMWHRHPGSMDTFSGTDDGTNFKYANSVGCGCISAIINYDPNFRITFYYAEPDTHHQIRYTKVDVEVGDDKITNKNMMLLSDLSDIKSRM